MAIEWIAFHVTDRCQLDCQHCLRDPRQKPTDLPLALLERVLDQAIRLYRSTHVILTGGEPMLHPDFAGIVDAAVKRNLTWHFVTNGKRFARLVELLDEDPRRGAALTLVNFSLDGATEAVHDKIRGAGSYREVMSAVSLAAARALPFLLQMTVHAGNVHELEAMAMTASHLGASRLSFAMMQPTGTHHDESLRLSAHEWKQVGDRIDRLKTAFVLPITMTEGFYSAQPFHVCGPFRGESLHVDVHGRLNLCCQHADLPGEGLSDIAGDLASVALGEAHGALLDIIHQTQKQKLSLLQSAAVTEWDLFPCNSCLKAHGKPHWTEAFPGVAGPTAVRERWTGAWEKSKTEGERSGRALAIIGDRHSREGQRQ